jgi:hypothetical protein
VPFEARARQGGQSHSVCYPPSTTHPFTLHLSAFTLHPTACTLHPAPFSLHPANSPESGGRTLQPPDPATLRPCNPQTLQPPDPLGVGVG